MLSGGLDSCTLLHHVARNLAVPDVCALSFAYGQKHARELDMARRQAKAAGVREHREIDIGFLGTLAEGMSALTDERMPVPELAAMDEAARRQPVTYVPHRNLVLLAVAAAYAEGKGIRDVFYGAQAQDAYGYWDCTEKFVQRVCDVLALNPGASVRVHAPFAGMSKAEVLSLGLKLGVDYGITWTCYRGGKTPCGTCPSCDERRRAFAAAGVADPLLRESAHGEEHPEGLVIA